MAGFEYGGGGEDLSGTRPFESDYMGYDPRLPSQRFDSSQRFDESFRAPDQYVPSFGDETKELDDEYKGANGYGYHEADAPPSYGYGEDLTGQSAEVPSGYVPTFEPDLHSDFGGEVNYSSVDPVSGNGFGANHGDDNLFSSLPSQGNGPLLPEPEAFKEEGAALRAWKRENAIRLEEKERMERERLAKIINEADFFKDETFAKRKTTMENGKKSNRDKEKTYLTNQENFHKTAHEQYWKAVAELIPNELPTIDLKTPTKKDKKDKDRKPSIVAIKGPKPGKPTDLSRMRQVLIKLKHTPPPHMKPPPPPPAPVAEKDKDGKAKDGKAKDEKAKGSKDGKEGKENEVKNKDTVATKEAVPVEADPAATPPTESTPAEATPPVAPVAAAVTA